MSTEPLSTIGLSMPDDFEFASYEAVHSRVGPLRPLHVEAWTEYAAAWNAIGYRFYACDEYDRSFADSLQTYGGGPVPAERHRQERDLYGFFTSGLSVIESFCYGLFAIASMIDAQEFPIATDANKRAINPGHTVERFSEVFPQEKITEALRVTTQDRAYKNLRDMRNILAHRTTPPRDHSLTLTAGAEKKHGKSLWGGVELNENTTAGARTWLAEAMRALLRAADIFAAKRLAS